MAALASSKMTLLFIATTMILASVYCASHGRVGICDANYPTWGCRPEDWPIVDGSVNRKGCTDPDAVMSWASRTVRTDGIILFVGDESSPDDSYQPGKITDITVKVVDYRLKYRGLLLYAEDEAGNRVGRFAILPENPQIYHVPFGFGDHPCAHVVTHFSADLKPLVSTFKFVAPLEGTGKITIRCLIKEGDANVGAFFWPNLGGDVELEESDVELPEKTVYESLPGQSCTEACNDIGGTCNNQPSTATNNDARIDTLVDTNNLLCNAPFIAGCSNLGLYKKGSHCLYREDTCSQQVTCDTREQNRARLCTCTGVPGSASARAAQSPASVKSTSFGLLFSMLAMAMLFTGKSKATGSSALLLITVLCLSTFFTGALGHNWCNSNARAVQEGSTIGPCPPRTEDIAHVQVGNGQEFEIEWTTGHPGNIFSDQRGETPHAYFTIIKAEDESKLGQLTSEILDQYIESAPSSAIIPDVKQWHRQIAGGDGINVRPGDDPDGVYAREIFETDPEWIPRPAEPFWGTKRYTMRNKNNRMFEYNPDKIASTIAVSYSDPSIPFVLAVYRFKLALGLGRPFDVDFANFKIPEGSPVGQYIVQYYWKGYWDCIDVVSTTAHVTNKYGTIPVGPPPAPTFKRVDHCFTPDYQTVHGDCMLVTNNNPQPCLDICSGIENCDYVVVVPTKQPPNYVIPGYYPPSCNALQSANANDDNALLCYAVTAREPTTTLPKALTTTDPDDPYFYSTCMIRKSTIQTEVPPVENNPVIAAIYRDKCISCDDRQRFTDFSKVWAWNTVTPCRECGVNIFDGGDQPEIPDYRPPPPPPPPTVPTTLPPTAAPTTAAPTATPPPVDGQACPVAMLDVDRTQYIGEGLHYEFMNTFFVARFPTGTGRVDFTATVTSSEGLTPQYCFAGGPSSGSGNVFQVTLYPGSRLIDVLGCGWQAVDRDVTVVLTDCVYSVY